MSQALLGTLQRALSAEDVTRCSQAFILACEAGALCEHPIKRSPGVSFNPRPARICQILSRDTHVSAPLLIGAIFSCVAEISATNHEEYRAEIDLAVRARRLFSHPATNHDPSGQAVALALSLDEVRHLHMSTLPRFEQTARRESAEALLMVCDDPAVSRLAQALRSAIEMQRRLDEA